MSYIGSKPANKPVVASDLDPAVITGQTALTSSPAATDEFIISDAGVLKRLDASLIGGGKIGQVVSVTKADTFSTTSSSFTDITGLTVNITPVATSSKILVMFNCSLGNSTDGRVSIALMRASSYISVGDAASSRIRASGFFYDYDSDTPGHIASNAGTFLDSPSSTSEQTYKMRILTSGGTAVVNKSSTDSDSSQGARTASTITVMEVLA